MSLYLLDTGPLTAYLFGRPAATMLIDLWVRIKDATTSPLVYAEVTEYLQGLAQPALRQRQLRLLLREIRFSQLNLATLEHYANVRRRLRPPHGPGLIGDFDTMIAATAIASNLTLVTTDSDFRRVPGLKLLFVRPLR